MTERAITVGRVVTLVETALHQERKEVVAVEVIERATTVVRVVI